MLAPMLFGDGHATHTYVQDAEALAAPGEQLSWWQLMVQALPYWRKFAPVLRMYCTKPCSDAATPCCRTPAIGVHLQCLFAIPWSPQAALADGRQAHWLCSGRSNVLCRRLPAVPLSELTMTISLQGRARTVGQVLLGYFEVPFNMDDPVTIAINPAGDAARSAVRCASSPVSFRGYYRNAPR